MPAEQRACQGPSKRHGAAKIGSGANTLEQLRNLASGVGPPSRPVRSLLQGRNPLGAPLAGGSACLPPRVGPAARRQGLLVWRWHKAEQAPSTRSWSIMRPSRGRYAATSATSAAKRCRAVPCRLRRRVEATWAGLVDQGQGADVGSEHALEGGGVEGTKDVRERGDAGGERVAKAQRGGERGVISPPLGDGE